MIFAAALLLVASAMMGLTTWFLALLGVVAAAHFGLQITVLGSGLWAMLAILALWSETALVLRQTGVTRDRTPLAEGYMGASVGLTVSLALWLVAVPGALILLPLITGGGCLLTVYRKRRDLNTAVVSTMTLMTDRGDGRYLRGIIQLFVIGLLLRRAFELG